MSLIVEDGTGRADAESFASVADADTYHSNRGNAAWAGLDNATKEVSLRRATDYMQQMYRSRWSGWLLSVNQALAWPRLGALKRDLAPYPAYYPENVVPNEVKFACAELALRASTSALLADLTRAKSKVGVGPLSVEYDPASPEQTRYASIEAMLAPLFDDYGSANSVRLVRT